MDVQISFKQKNTIPRQVYTDPLLKRFSKPIKPLSQVKTNIVFKKEDYMELDKLAQEQLDKIQELITNQKYVTSERFDTTILNKHDIHSHLKFKLNQMNIQGLTSVQKLSFPQISQGNNVLVKSVTGTGKTLAFLLPIINQLLNIQDHLSRQDLRVLIISPTKDLAQQTEQTTQKLINSTRLVLGSLTGSCARDTEKALLRKGANIISATPGRLQDHLNNTASLRQLLEGLKYLILDECDQLLDESNITKIIDEALKIPKGKIQKIFVSATLSDRVAALGRKYLENPVIVQPQDQNLDMFKLPQELDQQFTIVHQKMRLSILISYLVQLKHENNHIKQNKHVLIIVGSRASCDFLYEVLERVYLYFEEERQPFHIFHGNLRSEDRQKLLQLFKQNGGIIIATDIASRGLNLGGNQGNQLQDELCGVDIVIQYEASQSVEQYVHRAGRAARIGQFGQSILFLLQNECPMLLDITQASRQPMRYVPADQFGIGDDRVKFQAKIQQIIEEAVQNDEQLQEKAIYAYQAFIGGYGGRGRIEGVFSQKNLHLGHIAKSFGLQTQPSKISSTSLFKKNLQTQKNILHNASEKTKKDLSKKIKSQQNKHQQ